ncbi:DUF6282 family protein [Pseudoalteromonas sp. T1lg23B]|uniref:DUF6282 family protein n=1 Tax=Pseudoalteromonas sp. T1lg23B TaxID=2077097 RepID=UPI000CF6D4A2|nr:DUF6282 family protein [Pseudoalteromonas sp. T1lg23B]
MATEFVQRWEQELDFLDVHYHVNPDTYTRRFNSVQAGREYQKLRGGVVLKSHLGCACAAARTAIDEGLPVFGSIVLNQIAGGLSVRAIQSALAHYDTKQNGRLIVHLPTIVPNKHRSTLVRKYHNDAIQKYALQELSISDASGKLKPQMQDILQFCKEHDVVLSSGHASRAEVEALVEAADVVGGVRVMLNQPANPITGMDANALKALGSYDWLYVEQTALTVLLGYQTIEDFGAVLDGVHNAIYSSDLGQTSQMLPMQWLSHSQDWFATVGLSQQQVTAAMLHKPLAMLSP